jgi:hypothetical protein
MVQNIDSILQRGERLDLLVDKTDTLAGQAYAFRRGARSVRRQQWWKNTKITVLTGVVGVVSPAIYAVPARASEKPLERCDGCTDDCVVDPVPIHRAVLWGVPHPLSRMNRWGLHRYVSVLVGMYVVSILAGFIKRLLVPCGMFPQSLKDLRRAAAIIIVIAIGSDHPADLLSERYSNLFRI